MRSIIFVLLLILTFGCSGEPSTKPGKKKFIVVGNDPVDSPYIKISGSIKKVSR